MQRLIHRVGLFLAVLPIVSTMLLLNPSSANAQVRFWTPDGDYTYGFLHPCRDGMEYQIWIDNDVDPNNQQPFTAPLRIDVFMNDYPNSDPNEIGDGLITRDDGSEPIFIGDVTMTYDRSTSTDNVYIGTVRWDSVVEPGQMFLDPTILDWAIYDGEVEASELPLIQDCLLTPELPNTPPDNELVAIGSLVGLGNKCMEIRGPGISNGWTTQLWDCNGETEQLWGLTDTGLIVHYSSKCLGVRNAISEDGSVVDVYDCIDAVNQFWDVTDSGNVIDFDRNCLDTRDDNQTNGTPLQISACAETVSQQWRFEVIPFTDPEPPTPTTNTIIGLDGNCLTVQDPPTNGTQVKLANCSETVDDNWVFQGDEIRYQDYCLEFGIPFDATGQVAQLWQCLDEDNQKWTLTADGELRGYSGQCLDVDESTQDEAKRVQSWDCDGGAGQQWVMGNEVLPPPPISLGGTLWVDDQCLTSLGESGPDIPVYLDSCIDQEGWSYSSDTRKIKQGGYCLSASDGTAPFPLMLSSCLPVDSQRWEYTLSDDLFRIYDNQCLDITDNVVYGGVEAKLVDCADWSGKPWIFTISNSDLRQPELVGDVNCDDEVDSVDALLILQYEVDLRYETNYCPLDFPLSININRQTLYTHNGAADINSDGLINAIDALLLLRCVVGFSNDFCPGDVAAASIVNDSAAIEAKQILTDMGLWTEGNTTIFVPIMAQE